MRGKKILIAVCAVIILLSLIPFRHHTLLLISPDGDFPEPTGFRIYTPPNLYPFEPAVGLADYFQSLHNPKKQLISWALWVAFLAALARKPLRPARVNAQIVTSTKRNKLAGAIMRAAAAAGALLAVVFLLVIFIPSKYRIMKLDPGATLIDIHSHTRFSHDGYASPARSCRWHAANGFDYFFVTDHSVNRYAEIGSNPACVYSVPLPGEETQYATGNNMLIVGLFKPLPSSLSGATASKIVLYAHSRGAAVIVPHWWHSSASALDEFADAGVDAFEVYGHAATPLSPSVQHKIEDFCRENRLAMLGGTNWHGWGNRNDVWTLFRHPGKTGRDEFLGKMVGALLQRKADSFGTLVLKRNEPYGALRVVFEPFAGLFYYFLGLNFLQALFWCGWIWAAGAVICRRNP